MADFCQECSNHILGYDSEDFKDLTTPAHTRQGNYAHVLCEGCGFILVNHAGKRMEDPTESKKAH